VATVSDANQDLAGAPLTIAEIAELRHELALAQPLPNLEIQLEDVNNAANAAAKTIAKTKLDRERASPQKYVLAALEALPSAMKNLETTKANLEALEAKGLPWWAPWRRPALEHAKHAHSTAKTQVHELTKEARAPILEEVEKATMEATKRLQDAQKERDGIELQMLSLDVAKPAPQDAARMIVERP
jgi:hypothetical protein